MSLPTRYKNVKSLQRLDTSRRNALAKAKAARDELNSPGAILMRGTKTVGGAFAAGVMDETLPSLPIGESGVKPSTVAGIGLAGAAIATGSGTLAEVATGVLCASAYDGGRNVGKRMKLRFSE